VENSLHLLEHLTSIPNTKASIKNFYIQELSRSSDDATQPSAKEILDEIEDDDWRAFFDSKPEEEVQENSGNEGRASELSTHEALHSLQSHRSQFSAAWLAVLQHVKKSPEQSSRVLSILHRSILPHLLQPIQLMDWISACVDFGKLAVLQVVHLLNTFRWVHLTASLQRTVRIDSRAQSVSPVQPSCASSRNCVSQATIPTSIHGFMPSLTGTFYTSNTVPVSSASWNSSYRRR